MNIPECLLVHVFACDCKMVVKYIYISVVLISLVVLKCAHTAEIERTSVLKLKDGQVRGIVEETENGNKVNSYLGIRYGHANRFEKAKPAEPWSNVIDAPTFGTSCHQFGSPVWAIDNSTSEDCLYLNVYQPTAESSLNRSVMVWIHGGAFEAGSGSTSCKHIAHDGDVIVVTVNYRLGPLGFLYGGRVPGNLGLHDQILSLKWVQENIQYFGGDANKVTIFGESAGSISVGALILSPLTKGLFHRAIMQSGAPTAQFVGQPKSTLLKKTKYLALNLECPVDTIEHTIECLQRKTVAQLQNASINDFITNEFFVPLYGDELMPLKPSEALKTGKFNQVDLMFGVTRDEGTGFALNILPELFNGTEMTVATVKQGILKMMNFYGVPNGNEVTDFYTSRLGNPTQDELKIAVSSVWGDFHLVCPTILFGEEFAKNAPTNHFYSYRLMQEFVLRPPEWTGVGHAHDVLYLFFPQVTKLSPILQQLSQDMVRAWTNFGKTGNPGKMGSVQWESAFSQASLTDHQPITRYMHLETSKYKMVDNYYKQTCDNLWKPKIFN